MTTNNKHSEDEKLDKKLDGILLVFGNQSCTYWEAIRDIKKAVRQHDKEINMNDKNKQQELEEIVWAMVAYTQFDKDTIRQIIQTVRKHMAQEIATWLLGEIEKLDCSIGR